MNFLKTSANNTSNGVVSIQVSTNTSQGDEIMVNDITSKLTQVFGTSPRNIATHVMYCLPPNTMNGVAYAYINHWLSVYSNEWCNYPSAQMRKCEPTVGVLYSNCFSFLTFDIPYLQMRLVIISALITPAKDQKNMQTNLG